MFKLYTSKQDYNRVLARVPQRQMTAHVHVLYTHNRATVETCMRFTCINETGWVECKVLKAAVDTETVSRISDYLWNISSRCSLVYLHSLFAVLQPSRSWAKHVDLNFDLKHALAVSWQVERCLSNLCRLAWPSSQTSGQPSPNLINISRSSSWHSGPVEEAADSSVHLSAYPVLLPSPWREGIIDVGLTHSYN